MDRFDNEKTFEQRLEEAEKKREKAIHGPDIPDEVIGVTVDLIPEEAHQNAMKEVCHGKPHR